MCSSQRVKKSESCRAVKVHAAGKIDFRGLLTPIIYVAPKGLQQYNILPASSKLKFFLQEGSEKWK